jgi:hypothetical protein
MARGKAYAGPQALWNWGLGDTRKRLVDEAAKSDLRNRAPPTIASVIYPHLRSARAAPPEPKRNAGVATTLYPNLRRR